jgi:hypothetical protein
MSRIILIFVLAACASILFTLGQLGYDYVVEGHGLHPAIAVLCMGITCAYMGICAHIEKSYRLAAVVDIPAEPKDSDFDITNRIYNPSQTH